MFYTFKVISKPDRDILDDVRFVGAIEYTELDAIIVELSFPATEYDKFVKENSWLERWIGTAPAVAYGGKHFGSLEAKQPEGFKEVLAKIGENNPHSPLADRYRKNVGIKEVRTKEVINKHNKIAANKSKEAAKRAKGR